MAAERFCFSYKPGLCKAHSKGVKISQAQKLTDAKRKTSCEAGVHAKDVVFYDNENQVYSNCR
jgi:hypothetical protein